MCIGKYEVNMKNIRYGYRVRCKAKIKCLESIVYVLYVHYVFFHIPVPEKKTEASFKYKLYAMSV